MTRKSVWSFRKTRTTNFDHSQFYAFYQFACKTAPAPGSCGAPAFDSSPQEPTFAERIRFRQANGNDEEAAAAQLRDYLEWRQATLPLSNDTPKLGVDLPRMIFLLGEDEGECCSAAAEDSRRTSELVAAAAPSRSSDVRGSTAATASTSSTSSACSGSSSSSAYEYGGLLEVDKSSSARREVMRRRFLPTMSGISQQESDAAWPRDKVTGCRCLVFLAALYPPDLGSTSEYVTAVAEKLEQIFDRESEEKFTLLLDTRAGRGWTNGNVWNILAFTQQAVFGTGKRGDSFIVWKLHWRREDIKFQNSCPNSIGNNLSS